MQIFEVCNHDLLFTTVGVLFAGKKGSKYRFPRKTSIKKIEVELTQQQKEVIVGTMLGDASMERVKTNHNSRIAFQQTFPGHASYVTRLFIIFRNLVGQCPRIITRKPDIRTGNVYSTLGFKSLTFPCLNTYYELFYKQGVKTVPLNIEELLTPQALAYWIMDDGGKGTDGSMILHTRAYTLADVKLLQQALYLNFKLETRLTEKVPNQWVIVISAKQETSLKNVVLDYMCLSMLYKLH